MTLKNAMRLFWEKMRMNLHKDGNNKFSKNCIMSLVLVFGFMAAFHVLSGKAYASGDDSLFGRVDSFTGELVTESSSEEAEEQTTIALSDTCYYDLQSGLFGYHTEGGDVFATVPDGMITRENVTVYIPEGMESTLYWEGLSAPFTGATLSDKGGYTVEVTIDGQPVNLFSFVITGAQNNNILNYTMPAGFRIVSATRDGEETPFTRGFVDMSQEGRYYISYDLPSAGIAYTLDLLVDVTPPTLIIYGIDEQGKARGPVTIERTGENDVISVTRDGEAVSMLLSYTFTQSGKYVATVTDTAGNATEYPFTILIYLDKNGWIFGALFIVVIAAVVGYIIYKRKHLKVR